MLFDKSVKLTSPAEADHLRMFNSITSFVPQDAFADLRMSSLDLLHCFDTYEAEEKSE